MLDCAGPSKKRDPNLTLADPDSNLVDPGTIHKKDDRRIIYIEHKRGACVYGARVLLPRGVRRA